MRYCGPSVEVRRISLESINGLSETRVGDGEHNNLWSAWANLFWKFTMVLVCAKNAPIYWPMLAKF